MEINCGAELYRNVGYKCIFVYNKMMMGWMMLFPRQSPMYLLQ